MGLTNPLHPPNTENRFNGEAQGRLAQLVEHLVYTEGVGGSSPSPPISAKAFPLRGGAPSWQRSTRRAPRPFRRLCHWCHPDEAPSRRVPRQRPGDRGSRTWERSCSTRISSRHLSLYAATGCAGQALPTGPRPAFWRVRRRTPREVRWPVPRSRSGLDTTASAESCHRSSRHGRRTPRRRARRRLGLRLSRARPDSQHPVVLRRSAARRGRRLHRRPPKRCHLGDQCVVGRVSPLQSFVCAIST